MIATRATHLGERFDEIQQTKNRGKGGSTVTSGFTN